MNRKSFMFKKTPVDSYIYILERRYKRKFFLMALTKTNIISKIITESGLSNKKSIEAVENIVEIIKSTLESGEDVLVSGFGKFCVAEKNARKGRNPATGKETVLPARKIVTFKCSGKLRERINGKA